MRLDVLRWPRSGSSRTAALVPTPLPGTRRRCRPSRSSRTNAPVRVAAQSRDCLGVTSDAQEWWWRRDLWRQARPAPGVDGLRRWVRIDPATRYDPEHVEHLHSAICCHHGQHEGRTAGSDTNHLRGECLRRARPLEGIRTCFGLEAQPEVSVGICGGWHTRASLRQRGGKR